MDEVFLAVRRISETVGSSEASVLIDEIRRDIENESRKLDEALASADSIGARRRLHSLTGIFATFGFSEAAEMARALPARMSDPATICAFQRSITDVIACLQQSSTRI